LLGDEGGAGGGDCRGGAGGKGGGSGVGIGAVGRFCIGGLGSTFIDRTEGTAGINYGEPGRDGKGGRRKPCTDLGTRTVEEYSVSVICGSVRVLDILGTQRVRNCESSQEGAIRLGNWDRMAAYSSVNV
jgi:hypothetical protein